MRNPERVLNSLSEHSKVSSYKFERLYRVLFNSEMFLLAYHNIQGRQGNMTEGSDGKTIDGMSLKRIENLIDALKDESYQPKPARRTYIPKKNGNMRPLGIPSIDDKLVQEVLRMLLEAIYEGSFENTSHGFRPKRSCHTALIQVQKNFTAAKWFIEGDRVRYCDKNHSSADEAGIRLHGNSAGNGKLECDPVAASGTEGSRKVHPSDRIKYIADAVRKQL